MQVEGQTNVYHPFPDSSAKWNQMYWYDATYPTVYYPNICFISGDTVIASIHYKKLLASGYKYATLPSNSCCYYYNTYAGAIRQDTIHKKVYYYRNNSSTPVEMLLYNFNLNVDDTLPASFNNQDYPSNYVSSIDSFLIGTSYRKQYHISVRGSTMGQDSNYVQLIEGIGSTFGLTYGLIPPFEGGSALYCFSQNNIMLYPNSTDSCNLTLGISTFNPQPSTFQIYPNPANTILNVELRMQNETATVEIHNTIGNCVHRQIAKSANCQINVSDLAEGVYTISISSKEGVVNKKFVIVK